MHPGSPPPQDTPKVYPVIFFADDSELPGYAEHVEQGALLLRPRAQASIAVGTELKWNWRLSGAPEAFRRDGLDCESLIVTERFTISGSDCYTLVPPRVAATWGRSSSDKRNRRRGFRVDARTQPVRASFHPFFNAPICETSLRNISHGGAAVEVTHGVEKRAARSDALDVSLELFPQRAPTQIRAHIRNRRLQPDCVVWGLSFSFEASPYPLRAEIAVRDYLIAHQLGAMKRRGSKVPLNSARPIFFIPTRTHYWEEARDVDPKAPIPWTMLEAQRTKAMATRLFPDVDFVITEHVPPSQVYERGSVNFAIKLILENRTSLRLQRRLV